MISCQKYSLLFIGIVTRIFFSGVYMCYMKKKGRDYVVRFLARQQEMSYHTFYFFFSLAPSLLTQHSSKQQLCVDVKTYRVKYLSTERGARMQQHTLQRRHTNRSDRYGGPVRLVSPGRIQRTSIRKDGSCRGRCTLGWPRPGRLTRTSSNAMETPVM